MIYDGEGIDKDPFHGYKAVSGSLSKIPEHKINDKPPKLSFIDINNKTYAKFPSPDKYQKLNQWCPISGPNKNSGKFSKQSKVSFIQKYFDDEKK